MKQHIFWSHHHPHQESPHSKAFLTPTPGDLPRSDAGTHLGAAAAGAHDSTAGHGALGAGRPGGSALRLVPAVREPDWTERVTLSAELSVWCCTIVPRAAGSGACQRNCYMRQIVPFIPAASGNPVTVSSEEKKKRRRSVSWFRERHWEKPIEKGRHWLCGW